jgi:hypothetical protein
MTVPKTLFNHKLALLFLQLGWEESTESPLQFQWFPSISFISCRFLLYSIALSLTPTWQITSSYNFPAIFEPWYNPLLFSTIPLSLHTIMWKSTMHPPCALLYKTNTNPIHYLPIYNNAGMENNTEWDMINLLKININESTIDSLSVSASTILWISERWGHRLTINAFITFKNWEHWRQN